MRSLILGVVIAAAAIGLAALTINTPNSVVGIIGSGVGLLVGAIFIHNGIFALSWHLGLIIRGAAGAIIAAITFSMFGANPSTEQFGMALLGIFLILWAMFEWRKRAELEQKIQTFAKLPPDKSKNFSKRKFHYKTFAMRYLTRALTPKTHSLL